MLSGCVSFGEGGEKMMYANIGFGHWVIYAWLLMTQLRTDTPSQLNKKQTEQKGIDSIREGKADPFELTDQSAISIRLYIISAPSHSQKMQGIPSKQSDKWRNLRARG